MSVVAKLRGTDVFLWLLRRQADLVPVAILLGLPLLLFWKAVFAGEVLYWGTPLLQFFPWREFAVESYLSGQVPLWNPYLGNGAPFAANWQSAVFYPLNVIYLLFPVERAMGYSAALHVGLAGVFMYVFGRVLNLSRFGSLIAGLSYAFGGFMVARAGFLSMTSTAAWLPLILAAAEAVLQSGLSFRDGARRTNTPMDRHLERDPHRAGVPSGSAPALPEGEGIASPRWERGGFPRPPQWERVRVRAPWALGSLAIGFQLLAGHGQLIYYSLVLLVFYTLCRGWQLIRMSSSSSDELVDANARVGSSQTRPDPGSEGIRSYSNRVGNWLVVCLPVMAMIALGLALGAIQLLPTAELAANSVRAGGAERDFAMAYSLWPWQITGLLAPDFFGNPAAGDYWGPGNYWEASGYLGVFPMLAAAIGLLAAAKRLLQKDTQIVSKPGALPSLFLFGMVVISLVLALGHYLPVYPFVFDNVPGFGFFQAPARFLFWYTFAMAALAGIGIDVLLSRLSWAGLARVGKIAIIVGISVCIAMGASALVLSQAEGIRPTFLGALVRLGVLLAVSGIVLLLGRRLPKVWWLRAIGLLVAVDLLIFGFPLNPTTAASVYDSSDRASRGFLRSGAELYRVYTPDAAFLKKFFDNHSFRTFGSSDPADVKRIRETIIPDVGMSSGLMESYNYDPLQVGIARDFMRAVDASGLEPRLLSLMNVRYVLTGTLPSGSALRPVQQRPGGAFENPAFLERAFVVDGEVIRAGSAREALQEVLNPRFDPRREVVLAEPSPTGFLGMALDLASRLYPAGPSSIDVTTERPGATVVEYSSNRVVIAAMSDKAGYLVLSDTYYPGWRAWVNGEPAAVYLANAAFRAVPLPAGRSVVEFRYEPAAFKLGATISALTLAAVVVVMALTWSRRRTG